MQQTQNYELNLIETSDTFSPAPLNENMEKLETALAEGLAAEAAARKTADTALSSRVTALETHKIITGSYKGDGVLPRSIYVGFTPRVVMVLDKNTDGCYLAINEGISLYLTFISGGFELRSIVNRANYSYFYLAIS